MVDADVRLEIEYAECLGESLESYFTFFYDYYAETEEKTERAVQDKDMFIRGLTDIQDKVELLHQRLKHILGIAYRKE